MRRIYLESIFGLIACFVASLFLYEVTVYQLNTDYEFILQDYEAQASQELIDNVAMNQGLEAAHQAMEQYAATARSKITVFPDKDSLPLDVAEYFSTNPKQTIYHDEDRFLWFRLTNSENIYFYEPDEQTLVRQKVELEDNLVMVFMLAGFMIYGLGHLLIIFRRVKRLEQATLRFSEGDFSVRAETKGGKAIGTMNRSFNIMADRISQLIESNRSLTNAIAHELRTPVFRIQWQAELLKDTRLDSEQSAKVDSIIEDTEEMEQMVDELLHYARLERGHADLNCEPIQVNEYVSKGIERWSKESELSITSSLSDSNPRLNADKKLLSRALDNLVRNACKFAEAQIIIEVTTNENKVTIGVHDDGPGVNSKHRERLFDPFYIADKSRNKAQGGYGLGLSIVKKICEQHGATVRIEDSANLHGALFIIDFPVCQPSTDKTIQ